MARQQRFEFLTNWFDDRECKNIYVSAILLTLIKGITNANIRQTNQSTA